MILRNFISHLLFAWKTHCGLKFHFGQFDGSEISTKVSFTPPEVMWTLIMKLPHTKVKFYPEVKSQTGLSSLRVSCKRALRNNRKWKHVPYIHFVVLKESIVHVHIQIPKVLCFVCLSDCYGIGDKYLNIFGHFLILKY